MPHALIVDDDAHAAEALAELVADNGFTTAIADSLQAARDLLSTGPDVILLDLVLPDGNGLELLRDATSRGTETQVVVVTGHATLESSIEAMRHGATDYLLKPINLSQLRGVLSRVARPPELSAEVKDLRTELRSLGHFGRLVGASTPMQRLYDQISRVAPTNATVFITGESGTGKEMVAQTIHEVSRRRLRPFLAVNCGAISPQIIESELFGHEKGSFTGASRQHRGYFERAHGGTLFLDEITEMPMDLQVKLLRVLETQTVSRVGSDRLIEIDVRASFARTCCTGCRCFRCTCRRYASMPTTSSCSPHTSSPTSTSAAARARRSRRPPSIGCAAITGRATSASCRTRCTARTS
jgi:two-component system response regulator AtoC